MSRKLSPQQTKTLAFFQSVGGWHSYHKSSKKHITRLVKRGLMEDSGFLQARIKR